MALKRQLPADPLSLTPRVHVFIVFKNMSLSLTPGLLILEQGLFNGIKNLEAGAVTWGSHFKMELH